MNLKCFFVVLCPKPIIMQHKTNKFFKVLLLSSSILLAFSGCNNGEDKSTAAPAADTTAKMQATPPPPPAAAKAIPNDSGQTDLDTTAHSRPLKPTNKIGDPSKK